MRTAPARVLACKNLRLRVEARTITTEGREIETSGIALLEEDVGATAAKVLAGRQEPSRVDAATDFLRKVLAEGPLPRVKVQELAADEEITLATLKRAAKKLEIESSQKGFGGGCSWTLPSTTLFHSAHPETP